MLLAKAGGWQGMAQGQALDLSPARQGFSAADIATMQALKTGALFRFACEAGAVLGRASPAERAALWPMPRPSARLSSSPTICSMPQGDAEALGKAVAKDEARGKATLVALLGVEGAKEGSAVCCNRPKRPLRRSATGLSPCCETVRFAANRKS